MIKSTLLLAVSAFASSIQAQTLATFSGVNWTGPFIEGQNYTLSWTIGNGKPVSANLMSGNYSQPIFGMFPAFEILFWLLTRTIVNVSAASVFIYTIPDPIAEGTYSIQLLQSGNQSDVSPLFSIFMAPLNTSASATATFVAATGTGLAGSTTYVYFDEHCGCTKTGLVPAATVASTGTNYTVPIMTTPMMIGTYTGVGTNLRAAWMPSVIIGAVSIAMFA